MKITNVANQKSVTVTVADVCPGCKNANSIDLSTGAFDLIADESAGTVPIEWTLVDGGAGASVAGGSGTTQSAGLESSGVVNSGAVSTPGSATTVSATPGTTP